MKNGLLLHIFAVWMLHYMLPILLVLLVLVSVSVHSTLGIK